MQHQRGQQEGLECRECHGRSFSDPTKPYHYPECSRYVEWRFGPRRTKPAPIVSESQCPHGAWDWTYCPTCTAAADYDDGGDG